MTTSAEARLDVERLEHASQWAGALDDYFGQVGKLEGWWTEKSQWAGALDDYFGFLVTRLTPP